MANNSHEKKKESGVVGKSRIKGTRGKKERIYL
jgi:hypothetical protein